MFLSQEVRINAVIMQYAFMFSNINMKRNNKKKSVIMAKEYGERACLG